MDYNKAEQDFQNVRDELLLEEGECDGVNVSYDTRDESTEECCCEQSDASPEVHGDVLVFTSVNGEEHEIDWSGIEDWSEMIQNIDNQLLNLKALKDIMRSIVKTTDDKSMETCMLYAVAMSKCDDYIRDVGFDLETFKIDTPNISARETALLRCIDAQQICEAIINKTRIMEVVLSINVLTHSLFDDQLPSEYFEGAVDPEIEPDVSEQVEAFDSISITTDGVDDIINGGEADGNN
jgi:hypothetical protein